MHTSSSIALKALEFFGIVVLCVIVAAIVTNPALRGMPAQVRIASQVMILLIRILVVTSMVRMLGKTNYRWLTVLGLTLLITGGLVVYLVPEFFSLMIVLPEPFWAKVSWYALPAVVIEGGILTLFTVLVERGLTRRTSRERWLLGAMFVLYSVFIIAINFLALNGRMSVEGHVFWSRVVVSLVLVVTVAVLYGYRRALSSTG